MRRRWKKSSANNRAVPPHFARRRPEVAVKQQANGNENDCDRASTGAGYIVLASGVPCNAFCLIGFNRFGWVFAANSCRLHMVGWGFPNSAKIMTRIPSLVKTIFHFQSNCARLHDECARWWDRWLVHIVCGAAQQSNPSYTGQTQMNEIASTCFNQMANTRPCTFIMVSKYRERERRANENEQGKKHRQKIAIHRLYANRCQFMLADLNE